MKLRELITRVNKSKEFKSDADLQDIARDMDLNYYGWVDQNRLVSYFIGSWYCTDTYVGYKIYFFDDEPVAVSTQVGRKCSEEFQWLSIEGHKKVRDYIISLIEEENNNTPSIADLDEEFDFYRIEFNSQLFSYHFDIPFFNNQKVKIVEVDKTDPYGISKKLKIRFEDNTEEWILVGELQFPFNVIN